MTVAETGLHAPLVEAVDVHRTYRPSADVEVHALRGVSFQVGAGDAVAIIGPSGSGKSTLLNLLGALDRPDRGAIRFSGRDVKELSDVELARLRNRQIGFVFQSFHLLGRVTALENVALPLVYRGLSRRERRDRAADALEAVGLGDRMDHKPNELSGGQQQRVAIARALVTQADLLLADEPTGNLDTVTGAEILELLTRLHDDRGTALVIITHDPEVADVVDRVIEIRDGLTTDLRSVTPPLATEGSGEAETSSPSDPRAASRTEGLLGPPASFGRPSPPTAGGGSRHPDPRFPKDPA